MNATLLTFRGGADKAERRAEARPDACVLGERLFKDALVRERKRADRLATPFAVLVVDRSHQATDDGAWAPIMRAAAAARRDVDAVGWLEQDAVLALVLPEAIEAGRAQGAAPPAPPDRLAPRSRRRPRRSRCASTATASRPSAGGPDLPPVDLLLDAFVPAPTRPASDAAKRALDVLGSAVLLAVFAPVMLAAYLAVRWTSPGPALFRQTRIGRRGQPFTMLKFRSMRVDAGHAIHNDYVTWFITKSGQEPRNGDEVFKLTRDPRITTVGHWLRKSSLDELPQFWNVLRGDMSLVGPRPPLPFEVDKYQPWHRRRVLEAKPGLTGLWQVNGRSRTTFDEMVRMDLAYVRTRSLWADLRILAATPLAMFKGGA